MEQKRENKVAASSMADYGQPSDQGFYQSGLPMDFEGQPPPQQWGAPVQGEQQYSQQYPGYNPPAPPTVGDPGRGYSLYSQGKAY